MANGTPASHRGRPAAAGGTKLERRVIGLQIEQQALSREKDAASKDRLKQVEREIAELREQASGLKARWQKEKEIILQLRTLTADIDKAKTESELAQRRARGR